MNPARWAQVKDLLGDALDLPPAERRAFIERAAEGDAALRDEVWSLAEAAEGAEEFLSVPAIAVAAALQGPLGDDPVLGTRLGRYRILEEIGHGGMGTVYRAVRDDDEFEQEVAVKVARAGFNSAEFRNRFLYERQIHAFLQHPNIARLLDGGTTDDGRPYFVMELIEGETVTEYCARRELNLQERVELFRQICAAVDYAHRHLVVHRDLKPGNILITPDGQPKLLDFGIAKLLLPDHPSLSAAQTAEMARVLTPEYASPEQVRGAAINTSTDVYSLGLILYEMLTGAKGQRVPSSSPMEMERVICEREPVRPSRVNQALAGDLENIILKAVEKDPARRYPSVDQLAEDLKRYLDGRPVVARGNGRAYRLGKFVRRNKAMVAAVLALVLALTGGIISTMRQSAIAQGRFEKLHGVLTRLIVEHDVLATLPGTTGQRQKLVELALEYMDDLHGDFEGQPHLMRGLAEAYERVGDVNGRHDGSNLGNTNKALECYRKAIAIRESIAGQVPRERAVAAQQELTEAYLRLIGSLRINGRAREAIEYEKRTLQIREGLLNAEPDSRPRRRLVASSLQSLGVSLSEVGDDAGALDRRKQALAEFERLFAGGFDGPEDYRQLALAHTRVGSILSRRGQYAEARAQYDRALATSSAGLEAYPLYAQLRLSQTVALRAMSTDALRQKKTAEAQALSERANNILRKLASDDAKDWRTHSMLASAQFELAQIMEARPDAARALEEHTQVLAQRVELAERDPANAGARIEVAQSYAAIGRLQAGARRVALARESLTKARGVLRALQANGQNNSVGEAELAGVERDLAALNK